MVEVPLAAGGAVAVEEDVEAAALPAVEVLHHEAPAALRPGRELLGMGQEQGSRVQRHPVERAEALAGAEAMGFEHADLAGVVAAAVLRHAGGEAIGAAQVDLEAALSELGREVGIAERTRCSFCRWKRPLRSFARDPTKSTRSAPSSAGPHTRAGRRGLGPCAPPPGYRRLPPDESGFRPM